MMEQSKHKIDVGKEGEKIAANFLQSKGYEILETNYHYGHGEIDIVAKDNGVLVFIEVKTRINLELGEPEYAVNQKKIKQIKKMAELYLFDKELEEADCRFDVIAVLLDDKKNPRITHYENAFIY